MKKIIKVVDEKKGIMQITTVDERWYMRETTEKKTGLPQHTFVPSVTWITGHYPKGLAFYKWLAQKGWDEAEAIKQAAGDRGSKVHYAITDLLAGKEITMESKYLNHSIEKEEELNLEEYEALMSFADWFKETKPNIISNEIVVWNDEHGYAGTVDLVAEIADEKWIIDFKTSQYVWPEHELQVSAYKHALELEGEAKLGILQLGYKRNKHAYKFTELEDKFSLFLAAREIWKSENEGVEPKQKDYPLALSLVNKQRSSAGKKGKAK
jgi:ATP-dependent exoDNAse (exonuclease V) beta subunit